jgi:hypothetical protein
MSIGGPLNRIRMQAGWRRPVFGRRAEVSGAERNRGEASHIMRFQRIAAGQPNLHGSAGRQMHAGQARGQRRRVVGDDEVG